MTETLFKYIMESSAADHESSLRLHQTFLINQGAVTDYCYIVKNIIRFVFSLTQKITFSIFTSAVCECVCVRSGIRLLCPSESLLSLETVQRKQSCGRCLVWRVNLEYRSNLAELFVVMVLI